MNIKVISVFVVFVTSVLAQNDPKCGTQGPKADMSQGRIVNGKTATPGEFPWIVSLQYASSKNDPIEHQCGGAIINQNWVLTSAQCNRDNMKIVAGAFNISNPKESTQVIVNAVKNIRHPGFKTDISKKTPIFLDDIMLVKLEKPLDLSKPNIKAICVPEQSDKPDLYVKQKGDVAGWGQTVYDKMANSDVLNKLKIPIIGIDNCKKLKVTDEENKKKICTFVDDNSGAGASDQGAPLAINNKGKWIVAGLFSYDSPDMRELPNVYTNIAYYSDWIWDTVKNNSK